MYFKCFRFLYKLTVLPYSSVSEYIYSSTLHTLTSLRRAEAFGDVSELSSVMRDIRTDDRPRAFFDLSAPAACRAVITDPGTPTVSSWGAETAAFVSVVTSQGTVVILQYVQTSLVTDDERL